MALWDGYLRGGSVVIIGVAMAGDGIVGIEMKLCTKITYLIRPKWMDNNPVKDNANSL